MFSPRCSLIEGPSPDDVRGVRDGRSRAPCIDCARHQLYAWGRAESRQNHNILWFATWSDRYILCFSFRRPSTLDPRSGAHLPPFRPAREQSRSGCPRAAVCCPPRQAESSAILERLFDLSSPPIGPSHVAPARRATVPSRHRPVSPPSRLATSPSPHRPTRHQPVSSFCASPADVSQPARPTIARMATDLRHFVRCRNVWCWRPPRVPVGVPGSARRRARSSLSEHDLRSTSGRSGGAAATPEGSDPGRRAEGAPNVPRANV
jgi:hypothetical protein